MRVVHLGGNTPVPCYRCPNVCSGSMGRNILDAAVAIAPPDITVVQTALQLKWALEEAHQDIEIREHIDLSGLDDKLLAVIFSSTRSIRVRTQYYSITLGVVGEHYIAGYTSPRAFRVGSTHLYMLAYATARSSGRRIQL